MLGLEVLAEQVGDAAEEHLGERLLVLGSLETGGECTKRRRRLEQRRAEAFGEPVQEVEQRGIAVDVPGRELADLLHDPRAVAPSDERSAIREREHQRRVRAGERQAVALQLEVGDHLGLERPGGVRDGGAIAGEVLVLRARTARDVAPFAYQHAEAGAGEIGGAGEAVVTAADHNHVVALHGRCPARLACLLKRVSAGGGCARSCERSPSSRAEARGITWINARQARLAWPRGRSLWTPGRARCPSGIHSCRQE